MSKEKLQAIPLHEWHEKASKLFGKEAKNWRFVCPICKTVQTAQDFIDVGVLEETAKTSIAVECIGRFIPKKQSQKAFECKKMIQGTPCDYTGYGLFKLNPVPVLFDDGKIFNAFSFDEAVKDE